SDDHVWKVVTTSEANGLEKSTRLLLVSAMSSFFAWLIDEKHLSVNPAQSLSKQRRGQLTKGARSNRIHTVDDPGALLRNAGAGYGLLFEVGLVTGLRISEVLGIRVRDIGETHLSVRGQLSRESREWTPRLKSDA